ncbi:hypothetical protein [Pseudomonas gingeri]|uniref:hypothetical protein n=1 Tax=Pseudomonas gingeri TaxID=117681 RepID=UPI0015A33F85|nr:hypothetical protein [Pseudomonas gingeri]NWA01268.1 hypothetical protein [Pseudomonas gingeri]NWA17604.1 hypothetical protein [Pseudomonas gingeri]NWA57041.1 hypothetical protein [Pseudomonas gingeri]NWA97014.1 hypothetical protein [Pseudomonas gingeri]NWB05454.1 hypothetical protein [Pseudomonas gingeri]
MPLYDNAEYLIRANLNEIAQGRRVRAVVIGVLTEVQFEAINRQKESQGLPQLEDPEIVFLGKHAYESRVVVVRDGHTIDDMVVQIVFALAETAIAVASPRMTAIKSTQLRLDGYGNEVTDEAIFELTARKPKAELYSIVPKGDRIKPKRQAK